MPKVLLVEDNDLNMKLFNDLLVSKHCDVIKSKDGYNVLELAISEKPDLIFMDIQLGGISGVDLIKALKQQEQTCKIPVVAITAFAMKHDEEKIMQSGCDMYIAKPVSINQFFEVLVKYVPLVG